MQHSFLWELPCIHLYLNFIQKQISVNVYFLAHLTRKFMWTFAISWPLSFSTCLSINFLKKLLLKPLSQYEPNSVRVLLRVFTFKIIADNSSSQPTLPLLLFIDLGVKHTYRDNNTNIFQQKLQEIIKWVILTPVGL